MARRNLPSISVPIVLASVTVPLAMALLVAWTLIFAQNLAEGQATAQNVWLLVLGSVAFMAIMTVLVMFAIFLVREILEVRRQDSFIDSVTHELKSPLASIKLGLQTMARPQIDSDKRELLRSMMLDDVDRLSSFIDDVLQASRLAHDRVTMDRKSVPLYDLVEECAESVRARHRLEHDAIVNEVDPELIVYTDRAALQVVVRNLIDNAVKYSDTVDVRITATVASDGSVDIEVRDHGIGIEPKDLKRVFHRFYRVQTERVRTRKGTGLGLFVVSALVRNLGGRVEALSDGPGHGTTMRVSLPRHASESRSDRD
jgi:signal transduction histidine kinase